MNMNQFRRPSQARGRKIRGRPFTCRFSCKPVNTDVRPWQFSSSRGRREYLKVELGITSPRPVSACKKVSTRALSRNGSIVTRTTFSACLPPTASTSTHPSGARCLYSICHDPGSSPAGKPHTVMACLANRSSAHRPSGSQVVRHASIGKPSAVSSYTLQTIAPKSAMARGSARLSKWGVCSILILYIVTSYSIYVNVIYISVCQLAGGTDADGIARGDSLTDEFVQNALTLHDIAQAFYTGRAVEIGAPGETLNFGAAHHVGVFFFYHFPHGYIVV